MKIKKGKSNILLLAGVVGSASGLFAITSLTAILHGISWGVVTVFQQKFFDGVTVFTTEGNMITNVLTAFVLLAAAYISCHIFNGAGNYVLEMMTKKMDGVLSFDIHKKISQLKAIDFEQTEKLDIINKAEEGKKNAIQLVSTFQGICCFYLPYFIFMGYYLFTLKPVLVLTLILIFLPTALTQIVRTRFFSEIENESASQRRKVEYYESCINNRKYYKETRLLGAFNYFKCQFAESQNSLLQLKYKATMKANLIELAMKIVTLIGYVGIILLLLDSVMKQQLSIGAFIAVFNALTEMYAFMEEVICYHVGEMAKGLGKVGNYLDFIRLEEADSTIDIPLNHEKTKLTDVCFAYPNTDCNVLDNINLEIGKGETVAIVGENGSGKTTLVKLIMGLYAPTDGKVEIDNHNLADLKRESVYDKISAVFQNFQRYNMKLNENITISKTSKLATDNFLSDVCIKSGVDAEQWGLSAGYETLLGKEFGGTDLSGGQWQRVAIARGYFRDYELIVLDEPTAAIDPYEESLVFHNFAEISKEKTALIVTHRMGSVKIADRIVVLKAGKIVEEGTFTELMHRDGEFKQMYSLQQQWYSKA